MAKGKQDSRTNAKKSKVVEMPQKDGVNNAKEQHKRKKAGTTKPRGSKEWANGSAGEATQTIKKEECKGAEKELRRWVQKAVKERSSQLATGLVETARDGDARCAAMVLSLIEKKTRGNGGDPDEHGLADELMEGPTWEEVLEARRKAEEEEAASSNEHSA